MNAEEQARQQSLKELQAFVQQQVTTLVDRTLEEEYKGVSQEFIDGFRKGAELVGDAFFVMVMTRKI